MGHIGVVELVLALILMASLVVGVPVASFVIVKRLLRAVQSGSTRKSQTAELTERLQRMEERLYDLAHENERLREDQRFTRELLLTRPPEMPRAPDAR